MNYDFKDNTYLATPKDNPKDLVQVEVGDSKEPDVILPQQKISRWNNECNVSIRLKDFDEYSVYQDKDKVIFGNEKQEVHIYPITEGEGGQEFEVILNEKPKTNVIQFSLVDKGVEYFYQPELTQEEKDKGAVRPENVIGSYAVYASENKINYVGGKEYKTGKVGHIYRPRIIDSAGTEVWGELHIDNGILSVTIPQDFLDKAVYPVRHAAGLTFGYQSYGATEQTGNNTLRGTVQTAPSDIGTITSISIGGSAYGFAREFKGVIVLKSNLNIVTNGISNGVNSTATSGNQIIICPFSSTPSVNANTDYVLMATNNSSFVKLLSDTTGAISYIDSSNSESSPTNPTDATSGTEKYTIYCTYTAGGGTVVKDLIGSGIVAFPR